MDERKFEDALHELGGPPVDPYAALDQMRPRLVGAGRRRAAARAGWLAAAAALLIGVGVAIALSNGGRGRVQLDTSDNGHLVTSTTTDASSIIITAPPAATTAPAGIETPTATTAVADGSTAAAPTPTVETAVETVTTVETTARPTAPRTTPRSTEPPPTSPASTPSFPTGRFRYETLNGHVDVDITADSLTLVTYEALNGATSEVKDNRPNRVEVRFQLAGAQSSILVRLDGGVLTVERKP